VSPVGTLQRPEETTPAPARPRLIRLGVPPVPPIQLPSSTRSTPRSIAASTPPALRPLRCPCVGSATGSPYRVWAAAMDGRVSSVCVLPTLGPVRSLMLVRPMFVNVRLIAAHDGWHDVGGDGRSMGRTVDYGIIGMRCEARRRNNSVHSTSDFPTDEPPRAGHPRGMPVQWRSMVHRRRWR
jgi:hypothetical protein